MYKKLPAALRALGPVALMLSLGACHTNPAADASAQGEQLHECVARSQQTDPGLSENQRQKRCHDQVGHAAFEAPPAAVPAPVH